ncbi:hypothetical protein FCL47_02275 [Desulfopila sp. IMCC35006]|uniref:hypothetical protein n=1 Tax=Desulfopila sp. IMCC35006 TaxID=2569542 RepID=UPI0010AC8277|nr:hypothetical protein [Desulfopila sp. IMCC35006]TKB28339.1 hypothetical protein FCL47_02275 [Desulfopila sp. IMCC35006]
MLEFFVDRYQIANGHLPRAWVFVFHTIDSINNDLEDNQQGIFLITAKQRDTLRSCPDPAGNLAGFPPEKIFMQPFDLRLHEKDDDKHVTDSIYTRRYYHLLVRGQYFPGDG